MQLFGCACILMLSIIVFYVLGKALCICCHWDFAAPEAVCVGFFFYFAAFQVIAEVLIFAKQPLHMLKNIWMVLLALLLLAAASVAAGIVPIATGNDAAQYRMGFCVLYRKYDDIGCHRYDVSV